MTRISPGSDQIVFENFQAWAAKVSQMPRAQKCRHWICSVYKAFPSNATLKKFGKPEFATVHKRLFRLGESANSALAIFSPRQLRKSDGFTRTRRHLPKRIRFVIALVIFGRMPQPGIAQKNCIWPQRDASFVLVSEMNLARGGFQGSWRHRGRMCFPVLF